MQDHQQICLLFEIILLLKSIYKNSDRNNFMAIAFDTSTARSEVKTHYKGASF